MGRNPDVTPRWLSTRATLSAKCARASTVLMVSASMVKMCHPFCYKRLRFSWSLRHCLRSVRWWSPSYSMPTFASDHARSSVYGTPELKVRKLTARLQSGRGNPCWISASRTRVSCMDIDPQAIYCAARMHAFFPWYRSVRLTNLRMVSTTVN